jgi:hypothetical protein
MPYERSASKRSIHVGCEPRPLLAPSCPPPGQNSSFQVPLNCSMGACGQGHFSLRYPRHPSAFPFSQIPSHFRLFPESSLFPALPSRLHRPGRTAIQLAKTPTAENSRNVCGLFPGLWRSLAVVSPDSLFPRAPFVSLPAIWRREESASRAAKQQREI